MLDDGPDRNNRDGRPQEERAQAEINLQVYSGAIGLQSGARGNGRWLQPNPESSSVDV